MSDPQSVPAPRDLLRRLRSAVVDAKLVSAVEAVPLLVSAAEALLAGVPVATDEPAEARMARMKAPMEELRRVLAGTTPDLRTYEAVWHAGSAVYKAWQIPVPDEEN